MDIAQVLKQGAEPSLKKFCNSMSHCATFVIAMLFASTSAKAVNMQVDEGGADSLFSSVTIYAGQGANHNLRELPARIVAANPDWEKSYFQAIGLTKVREKLSQNWTVFEGTPFASIRQGYELVLAKHHGLQDNGELGAAYSLRTGNLEIGAIGVNFAAGVGLSYAIGNPSYEDGSPDNPEKRYRLQQLMLFDLEWRLNDLADWSLVTRVHHRSGVYGLIAPRHVGSNFLAVGLRHGF